MRGLMEDGEEAEIAAADCENVSLSEVLQRVGRIVAAISRGKRERRLAKKREARELVQWLNGKCQTGKT